MDFIKIILKIHPQTRHCCFPYALHWSLPNSRNPTNSLLPVFPVALAAVRLVFLARWPYFRGLAKSPSWDCSTLRMTGEMGRPSRSG